jgi:hypothetical protein
MASPKVRDGDFDYVLDDQWWECAGRLPRNTESVRNTGQTHTDEAVGKALPPASLAQPPWP